MQTNMKPILAAACLLALASVSPAEAKGCIKGAIVGGVAGHMAGAGIIVADIRHRIDIAAAVDGGLHMRPPQQTPIAFDHRIGCVDAIDCLLYTSPSPRD